jgi:glucokinase
VAALDQGRLPARALSVGVDLGGTKCLAVTVDEDGAVVDQHRLGTPLGEQAVVDAVVDVVEALGAAPTIGVGAPGLVDVDGVLRFAPNLPGVSDLPLRAELEERFPRVHVRVENDANCAGWAERERGAARGTDHALLITLGTGIGGGIVAAGALLRGAAGFAGEIGHMVVDPDGPRCPCGKQGCWERLASGAGLGRLAREAALADPGSRVVHLAGGDPEAVRGEHVTRAAAEGDEGARTVMSRFAWWVALGLANLANIFDPELLVLGGGMVAAGDALLAPVRESFAELVEAPQHRAPVPIVPAALGERAGAIGAALLAREENGGRRAVAGA